MEVPLCFLFCWLADVSESTLLNVGLFALCHVAECNLPLVDELSNKCFKISFVYELIWLVYFSLIEFLYFSWQYQVDIDTKLLTYKFS